MNQWTANDMPNLQGRVAIVTGANSGLGFESTKQLAAKGAHVIMASRNLDKLRQAQDRIVKQTPNASLEIAQLDLASLASVRDFAAHFHQTHGHLDLLLNNAGITSKQRRETVDGFEMVFGTNHLGPFALTGLLLPTLLATTQSRVVTLSSMVRRKGKMNFDDLQSKHSYADMGVYGESKRMNLLFALELQHRLAAAGASTISVAAHPGVAKTNIQPAEEQGFMARVMVALMAQRVQMAALPELYAATSPTLWGGELVGPNGFLTIRGYPQVETKAQQEYDRAAATRLWGLSAELTGVDYAILQRSQNKEPEAS